MPFRISHARLLLGLLVYCCTAYAKDKAEEQGRPLLKAAADRSLLHPDIGTAVNVKFSFVMHASGSGSKQMQGTYSWLMSESGDWRKEMRFADYADLEVGHGSMVWIKRSLDFKPLQAMWVQGVLSHFEFLNNTFETIESYFKRSEHHVELRCLDLARSGMHEDLCFDSEGNLVKADSDLTYEYSDYRQTGQKFFPHQVVLKREGTTLLDGTIETLPTELKADQHLFEPPAGAIKRVGCLTPTPAVSTNKFDLEYPMAARSAHQQGTVTIYALIASDGTAHNPTVIQTAGKELDEAAWKAVTNAKFEPAKCAEVPIDYETAIRIRFRLRSR